MTFTVAWSHCFSSGFTAADVHRFLAYMHVSFHAPASLAGDM